MKIGLDTDCVLVDLLGVNVGLDLVDVNAGLLGVKVGPAATRKDVVGWRL